jgi:hypothetical protein
MGQAFSHPVHPVAVRGSGMAKRAAPQPCAVPRPADTPAADCMGDYPRVQKHPRDWSVAGGHVGSMGCAQPQQRNNANSSSQTASAFVKSPRNFASSCENSRKDPAALIFCVHRVLRQNLRENAAISSILVAQLKRRLAFGRNVLRWGAPASSGAWSIRVEWRLESSFRTTGLFQQTPVQRFHQGRSSFGLLGLQLSFDHVCITCCWQGARRAAAGKRRVFLQPCMYDKLIHGIQAFTHRGVTRPTSETHQRSRCVPEGDPPRPAERMVCIDTASQTC